MAIFLNELTPFRLYRGQYYYPIDLKDRTHNSIVYLMTPNTESSVNILNNRLAKLNNQIFNSYFIEKNVNLIINNGLNKDGDISINNEAYDPSILKDLSLNESVSSHNDIILNETGMELKLGEEYHKLLYPEFVDSIINEETETTKFGSYNYTNIFRQILFNNRMRSQAECLKFYEKIRNEVRYLKYTFADLRLYKNRNLFYDWAFYTDIFYKNNTKFTGDRGLDVFFTFLNRFLMDSRFSNYAKKTIVIPVTDWKRSIPDTSIFDYKNSANPFSFIYRTCKINPSKLQAWKDYTILFTGENGYFTVDFNMMDMNHLNKFVSLTNNILSGEYSGVEEINHDSRQAIVAQLTDRLEKGGIVLSNLTGGTKELTKDELEKMGVLDDPSLTKDPEIKKAALVNKLDKIASKSTTTKDAIETLEKNDPDDEDNEWLKDVLLDLQSEDGIKMNAARKSRMEESKKVLLTKEVNGKSVAKLMEEFQKNDDIKPMELKIDSMDESWKKVKFANFNKQYDMDPDIVAMFSHFINVSHPMNIVDIKSENTSTSEDYIDTWTCNYEDAETGKRFTMTLDIPKLISNRFMKLRGNEKALIGQLMLLPVVKTDGDAVQLVSNYSKIFIYRKSPSGLSKSSPIVNKIVKALSKYEGKDIKVIDGDNRKVCIRYELPMEFIDLACMYSKIKFKDGSYISFNMDELSKIPFDKSYFPKGSPESKATDEMLANKYLACYVVNGKKIPFIDTSIDMGILNILRSHDKSGEFDKIYQSVSVAKRLMYSEASIMNTKIPVVVLLSYNIGLQRLLNRVGIKYEFQETRPSRENTYIKFEDGYLVYHSDDPGHNMLMNGLMQCDFNDYSIKQINSKDMWLDILDDFGGRIKADGFDNFYDLMIDPITKEICKTLNVPDNYVDLMIYGNDLLVDNKFNRHTDITGNRLRTNEVIVGHLYQVLAKAFGAYRTMIKRSKGQATFSAKRSAVIDSILTHDQTSSDLSTLTPLLEAETASKVTFKGLSGMNSDRAFGLDKRGYDNSMLGVLGISTGFSSTVGINRQTVIDAGVRNKRGFITPKKPEELNNLNTFSMMEALSPLAINHDDPFRTAMAFTQTSQHQMLVKKSMPSLITTGADEALPYLTSNKFAYKCPFEKAVVKEVTKDYMIIEDTKTKQKDYVDLRTTIQKNSDGGFYITTKLDPIVKVGQKLEGNDIVAYDKQSYSNAIGNGGKGGNPFGLSYNMGTLAKVAIMNTDLGYEDSCVVDNSISEALESKVDVQKDVSLDKNSNVYNMVSVGDFVQEGDPLLIFQDAFDEKEANELLKNITDDNAEGLSDLGRKPVRAKMTGQITNIKIYRTCDDEELSPTLLKIVKAYDAKINKLKKVMRSNGVDKEYTLEATSKLPAEGKLKHLDGVRIEFYIEVNDKFGIGDKLVFSQALKGVNSYIIPKGEEAFSDYRKDEYVNAFLTISGVMGRMVPSSMLQGLMNKLLIETARQCQEDLGIKPRMLNEILTDFKE